jgi:hypothetical protein
MLSQKDSLALAYAGETRIEKMGIARCPFCDCSIFLRVTKDLVKVHWSEHGLEDELIDNEGYEFWCKSCNRNVTGDFKMEEAVA